MKKILFMLLAVGFLTACSNVETPSSDAVIETETLQTETEDVQTDSVLVETEVLEVDSTVVE